MAELLTFQISWQKAWPDYLLEQFMPKQLTLGKTHIDLDSPWKLRPFKNLLRLQGQLAVIHAYKPGIKMLANVEITAVIRPMAFPNVQVNIEELRLIGTPKAKVLCIGIPIRRLAERQLQQQHKELESMINAKIQEAVEAQLLALPQRLAAHIPAGILLRAKGALWQIFAQDEPTQFQLSPLINVESLQPPTIAGRLDLLLPFAQEPQPATIQYMVEESQLNEMLQEKVKGMKVDTPAGEFKVETVGLSIEEQKLKIRIDFAKDKNGHLLLMGNPELSNEGDEIALHIQDADWKGVSIIKQGLFSLFESRVKKKLNEALSMDQERMAQMISTQLKTKGNAALQKMGGEILQVKLLPTFRKVELAQAGILVVADLSGNVAAHFDQSKHEQ